MKKYLLLFLTIFCLFIINVKADELPTIIAHKVMVTNKEGTVCYKDGSKTEKIIPYKTMLMVNYDINGSYINVINDDYDCDVKYSDVSANTQKFSLDTNGVEKINTIRAMVLPSTGLNMRIGPSVTYSKIITVPQNTIINLNYKAGTYWYFTEYNDKSGWVTAMNNYLGFDYDKVLINYEKTKIYSSNGQTVIASILENTEITDYIKLDSNKEDGFKYYVSYNGTKGYIKDMLYKTNGTGKIKLTKDVDIKDENGKPIKKMTVGSELEYTMVSDNSFYFPDKNVKLSIPSDSYEFIYEAKPLVKEKGYIGEGIFGEEKMEREVVTPTPEPEKDNKKEDSSNTKDIIIICLLAGIFISLTAIVVIKLINSKKNKPVVIANNNINNNDNKEV